MLTLSVAEFLSAVDKFIGLLKNRQIRRRDYFDEIIEPLYALFVIVGEDYLKLFREARKSLEEASKKTTADEKLKLLDKIRDRREDFLASRLRIRGLVDAFCPHAEKEKDKELLGLFEAMGKFFSGSVHEVQGGSVGRQLVDLFSIWAKPKQKRERDTDNRLSLPDGYQAQVSRERLEHFVSISLRDLESAWFEAAGRYADLQMKYQVNK